LSSENDFIDHILVQYLDLSRFSGPEQFFQRRAVARILKIGIEGIFYEIEKGGKKGETQLFGVLFVSVRQLGHKTEDIFGPYRRQFRVSELFLEVAEDEFMVPDRVFFSDSSSGN
jgi:hypothetical protein